MVLLSGVRSMTPSAFLRVWQIPGNAVISDCGKAYAKFFAHFGQGFSIQAKLKNFGLMRVEHCSNLNISLAYASLTHQEISFLTK
jgi:hypothetical protein